MTKALSLKLQEDIFNNVEKITHEINIPRNAYINKALEFYNKLYQRKLLKKQLSEESKLVQANSMKVLKEFEEIQDDLFE